MRNNLYDERLERIKKAVALEPVDKIPVVPCANAYMARSEGISIKDYISNYELACTANLNALRKMGAEATQNVIYTPWLLPPQWLSKIAVPGDELGDDELWQVKESENMKFEDYREVLDNGFEAFQTKFIRERCDDANAKLVPYFEYLPTAYQRFYEAGIPCICDFLMITPFEFFCGGRSLAAFFMDDLIGEPDLIDEVFKKTMEHTLPLYRGMMERLQPVGVWIGGWRASPEMISPRVWNRFSAPYIKAYADLCIEMNVIPIFHLDSNWTGALEWFRCMPPKKCIMALDSKTDIRKAKAILGDMMCILGDVPAELLAFGAPEEIYAHTTKLIDDIGPTGYIVSSGCDIPANARPENVQAMCDAANNYLANKR
ncbi:MAG: uroporphyrinogen decarboxylase [Clostridiales Family XIII bacterium]|nr:uroporphyrinogen decarboxylase [Clostridiales Family XIII bacterium]